MLPSETESPSVLPLPRLILILAASVGLSWFMVPRQNELVERLLKDRQYERVVSMLSEGSPDMAQSDLHGLHSLSARQLAAIAQLLKLTPREQLRAIFDRSRAIDYDPFIHNIVLAAIRYVDVISPSEAFDLIVPNFGQAPEAMRLEILRAIARNAHAVSQPALAARAQQMVAQSSASTWQDAQEMVQSFSWSNRTPVALNELKGWIERNEQNLPEANVTQAREMLYSLNLACNKPSDALDSCLKIMKKLAATDSAQVVWLERARTTALACGRSKDLVEPMTKYVGTLPQAGWNISQLRDVARTEPERVESYRSLLTSLATWSDWNSEFESAFEAHSRLAAMGELKSLDRCVELEDFLGRTEDCVSLLQTLGDIPERENFKAVQARMLAELGEDEKARPLFEAWLKNHPDDRNARWQYCCLLEDMGDEHGARVALEKMRELHPQDLPSLKKLAEARVREEDYAGALKIYQALAPDNHDADTLENYAMIAESLDDHEAQFRALQLAARRDKQPNPSAYLELAEAAGYLSDSQVAVEALQEGVRRLPGSAVLRVALAQNYFHVEQPAEAVATLLHPNLKNHYEAVETLLNHAGDISDPEKALTFLGDDVDKRIALAPRNRLQLAVLNQRADHTEAARRLFASVKETAATIHMIAEARMAAGEYDEAARVVGRHLQSNPRARASDWEFLGDIFEHLGRTDEARQAYDTSIALLTADIPETASN